MDTKMEHKTVIKLNNIPHGFYEKQMRDYFSQFGTVKNVLLVRSNKTHKSRGFGFVEFQLPQVARAAAEAMHNYLLFNQVLKCRQMNRHDLPKGLFKKNYKGPNSVELNKRNHNSKPRDKQKMYDHYKRIVKTQKLLKGMGIKLDCEIINMPQKDA
jgi:nucleolar protein 15